MENAKDQFKVRFRGVRGSYPIANKDYLNYGGNTSCVEVQAGEHLIIIDAGTGLIELGNELMQEHIASGSSLYERKPVQATLLLSHIHQDHIQGFTFFRPCHVPTTKLNVFGDTDYNETLADELAELLFAKTFPLDLGDIAASLNISNVRESEYILINNEGMSVKRIESSAELIANGDDVIISYYKSYAHPQDGVIIYKIYYKGKSVVYATDKESYIGGDKKLSLFARDCDLLIHDAQYTTDDYLNSFSPKQGYGHSTFEMALEAQRQAGAKQLAFYHFDPSYNDEKLDDIAQFYKDSAPTAFLAREGLEVTL